MSLVELGPWDEEPEVWSQLVLKKKTWPGEARVSCKRSNKWDEKEAQDEHAADRNFKGAQLAKLTIEILYWTSAMHAQLLTELLADVEPVPGKKKQEALEISHAVTIMRKVTHVTIDDVDGPEKLDDGRAKITIQATEHREPTAKNASGKAGVGGGGNLTCAQLGLDYSMAVTDYVTANASYNEAISNLKSFEGSFGSNASAAASFLLKADKALARMAAISAEQLVRGCSNSMPSSNPKTTAP